MKKSTPLLVLLALPATLLSGQTAASSTIQVNKVQAVINADGAMFTDGQQGRFVPLQAGLAQQTLLRSSGIWIAGIDPGGSLQGAIFTTQLNDFHPGNLDQNGLPESDLNKIWRVNCADVNQHKADFDDNGALDQPNPAIMAWPGRWNPYFNQYNDLLSLPYGQHGLAEFNDRDQDGSYDPLHGDYPSVPIRGCPLNIVPNDMAWFVMNDVDLAAGHPSGLGFQQIEIQTNAFVYETADPSPFNNTVFVVYKLINLNPEKTDSCYFGIYTDFSIGNPNDDYVGLDVNKSVLYGYNGDANDEGGFGSESPVMGLDLLRGPLNNFGGAMSLKKMIVLDNTTGLSPLEFYRVLSGVFPDGAPAPNNGLMYPGNPNDPAGQSELALGHPPGHRVAVASYGPFTLQPGAVNELIVAYRYAWQPGATAVQNVQTLLDGHAAIKQAFNDCFENVPVQCNETVDAPEALAGPSPELSPNPANGYTTLTRHRISPGDRVEIFDLPGRLLRRLEPGMADAPYDIPLDGLPAGRYIVRTGRYVLPLVVQH